MRFGLMNVEPDHKTIILVGARSNRAGQAVHD
jgi:hypothetical protein